MWKELPMGLHGHRGQDRRSVSCAIVTVSDTRTRETDHSGAEIRSQLEAAGHPVVFYAILPDDPESVRAELSRLAVQNEVEAVILNGGTGIAPRDTTYEAVASMLGKRIDGFGELFRMLSFEEVGAAAMISRAVAGLIGTTVVFSVPGSTAACRLAMAKLIIPELGHLVALAETGTKKAGA